MEKLISIITVTYNASALIEETILSVLDQSYNNIEYIIVDGGSTDTTIDIINKYKSEISCVISEPDNGIYDAMNKGIHIASGEFLYFLGAGDVLTKKGIVSLIGNEEDTIYYGNVRYIPSNRVLAGSFNKWKIVVNNIPHQAILYPISVFRSHSYNTKYYILADYELNLILFGSKKYRFHYIDCIIADFLEGGASGVRLDASFIADRSQIIQKHIGYRYNFYYQLRESVRKIYRILIPIR